MSGRAGVRGGVWGRVSEVSESQGGWKNHWGITGKDRNAVCNRPVWDAGGMIGCWTLTSGERQLS